MVAGAGAYWAMKTLTFLCALALLAGAARPAAAQNPLVSAAALPADSLTHRIKFSGVVAVPGVPAAELHARAREWVALTFADARQVTQLDDAARGVLIVRGYTFTWVDTQAKRVKATQALGFTCRLDFRDGRYRYEVFDLAVPLIVTAPEFPTLYAAPQKASRQAYEVAGWLIGSGGTVATGIRQALLQPDLGVYPGSYDVAASYGREWLEFSGIIYQTTTRLLDSLRQHVAAAPGKW